MKQAASSTNYAPKRADWFNHWWHCIYPILYVCQFSEIPGDPQCLTLFRIVYFNIWLLFECENFCFFSMQPCLFHSKCVVIVVSCLKISNDLTNTNSIAVQASYVINSQIVEFIVLVFIMEKWNRCSVSRCSFECCIYVTSGWDIWYVI